MFDQMRAGFRRCSGAMTVAALLLLCGPTLASAQVTPIAPATPPPAAWVLVDADTGAVLGGADLHSPLPPASTIKLLTALIAHQRLPAGDGIPISPMAESKPARKINVKVGQTWALEHLLYSMLLVSANDAAYAIAERVGGGSLDAEIAIARRTLERLGAVDDPVPNDPAGLDDSTFSNAGGSRISAWDLAIVARAVLAEPELTSILQTPHYEFDGGDGLHHTLNNHDTFLGLYDGATGMKTGGTDLAGRTFVGSAVRDGRTMLVVEFDAANIYASAAQFLDQGFATPVEAQTALPHLPDVVPDAALDPSGAAHGAGRGNESGVPTDAEIAAAPAAATADSSSSVWDRPAVSVAVLVVGGIPLLVVLRRRAVVRRRARRRAMALAARARQPRERDEDDDDFEFDFAQSSR
jgi:D-alanyl-D-alanine carboxypeptidase (penicillin-binding protein 5/6)